MATNTTPENPDSLPFRNMALQLEERVADLLGRLTLEEKFTLLSGGDEWHTNAISRLGIPKFGMTDGPHGIRPKSSGGSEATYFPTSIGMGATWSPDLANEFGKALAQEVRAVGSHMILGPGINIDRTPLNGRTFEYMTEDPFLDKKMAVQIVKGVQGERISACVKHFVANNQETNRFAVNSTVSERALQEIYLPAFKATVEEADAWGFMGCYNRVNGIYGCANKPLIKDVLMNKWGFRGFVVSDWGATKPIFKNEACIKAGLSLEMPKPVRYSVRRLAKSFKKNKFSAEELDDNVRRLLRVMFLVGNFDDPDTLPKGSISTPEHIAIARKIAEKGIVLLKNEMVMDKACLPLDFGKTKSIAILGPNADVKMSFGGGSSEIMPIHEITPYAGLVEKCSDKIKVTSNAEEGDVIIYVGGLNHDLYKDAEGRDRKNMDFPPEQVAEINSLKATHKKPIIVILINGSPVEIKGWMASADAIIEAWYPGMEGGRVLADIVFGDLNPSGKLPLSFPNQLSDSPAHKSKDTYPGKKNVLYSEGIFVGYRHFDKQQIKPLFPFGHGLSYTEFTYDKLAAAAKVAKSALPLEISVLVENSGSVAGDEVVQLYVQDGEASVERPVKELKGFTRISLAPGEKTTVTFELLEADFAFYDESTHSWKVEPGTFTLHIGSSSRDIRQQYSVEITN